jgi:ankyrin repeat protein
MMPGCKHEASAGDPAGVDSAAPAPIALTPIEKNRLLFPALELPRDPAERRCIPARGANPPHWLEEAAANLKCTEEARAALAETIASDSPGLDDRLTAAAVCDDADAVVRLLAGGANPNRRDSCGWTALVAAAATGHAGVTEKLLAGGAKPNMESRQGKWSRSALLAALIRNDSLSTSLLLASGANPNLATPDGRDALMFAATGGDQELVRSLLQRHADPCHHDATGLTAIAIAHAYGNDTLTRQLGKAARKCPETAK